MYKQFYQGMTLEELPLFALVLFVAVFLGVCAWLFGARSSQDYDGLSRLPLSERGEGGHE